MNEFVCECPEPGFCRRYNKAMTGRMHQICRGDVLTAKKCEAYRQKWLRERRYYIEVDRRVVMIGRPSSVGAFFKKMIQARFGRIACGECAREVERLNNMTIEEIEADRENILQEMVKRAPKIAPRWWQRLGAKLLPAEVYRQCSEMLDDAIELERKRIRETQPAPRLKSTPKEPNE